MNNPFDILGQFAGMFTNKFGNMGNMFNTINGFASQYDPKTFNPQQQAQNLVDSGQMTPEQRDMLYNMACGIANMMGMGGRR